MCLVPYHAIIVNNMMFRCNSIFQLLNSNPFCWEGDRSHGSTCEEEALEES